MIVSMTGFARSETAVPGGTLVCELRSVNHRFLEAALRLPEELRSLEGELRALLQKDLRRGKVDAVFTYRAIVQNDRGLDLDRALIERLTPLLAELAASTHRARASAQAHINLVDLLRFPGVLREGSADPEALAAAARTVFAKALTDLRAMRSSEGARLKALIEQRCEQLETHVAEVRARLPEVQTAIRARFHERLAELGTAVDAERFEQEIALLLQRMDVDEELDRLTGHIAETRKVIGSSEAAGRRLDFLMQEFNREANTLSSKSQDLATTRIAVDMKVLIEQMREQVQNIE
jgi:uncharacterized protein (TIGR00255 family)